MPSLSKALLLALPLANLVAAQTLVVDGEEVGKSVDAIGDISPSCSL
jgi:hypothetical protein